MLKVIGDSLPLPHRPSSLLWPWRWGVVRAKDVTARAPSKNVNSWALTVETAGLDSVRLLRFRSVIQSRTRGRVWK